MTYVSTYKQADLTLTGTMRKAQLAATATKTSRRQIGPAHSHSPAPSMPDQFKRRPSEISMMSQFQQQLEEKVKQCEQCHVKYSPIWWPMDHGQELDDQNLLCHQCHWGIVHGNDVVNGDSGLRANGTAENSLPNGIDEVQDARVSIAV